MIDVAEIVQRLDELEKRVSTAEREREQYRTLYLETMERCRKLELGIIASKSEHLPENEAQLSLDILSMMLGERQAAELDAALAAANAEQDVKGHTRRKPTGRKPLPEHLPRFEILVLPPEVERKGLDAFERIGEDVSETIERRPASLVVARVVRPKFVPKKRVRDAETEVFIAEPPELPIPRGLAGPGMLADTIVKRWQDHMPLHRLEDMYARDGLELARSTMCGWHAALAEVVQPLVSAMRDDAFKQIRAFTSSSNDAFRRTDTPRRRRASGGFSAKTGPSRGCGRGVAFYVHIRVGTNPSAPPATTGSPPLPCPTALSHPALGQQRCDAEVLREIEVVAPTDTTVLLQGESGTGEELITRAVHRLSARQERAFVGVNCAAVPRELGKAWTRARHILRGQPRSHRAVRASKGGTLLSAGSD